MLANSAARPRSAAIIVAPAPPAPVHPGPGGQPEQQARQPLKRGQVAHLGGARVQHEHGRERQRDRRDLVAEHRDRRRAPVPPEHPVAQQHRNHVSASAARKSLGKARCSQVTRRAPAGRSSGLTWRSKYSSTSSSTRRLSSPNSSAVTQRIRSPRRAASRHSAGSLRAGLQPAHQLLEVPLGDDRVQQAGRRGRLRRRPRSSPTRSTWWSPATASPARSRRPPPRPARTWPAAAGGTSRSPTTRRAARPPASRSAAPRCAAAPPAPSAPDARRPAAPAGPSAG